MSFLAYLFFWHHKAPQDNTWHPVPGASATPAHLTNRLPSWTSKLDPEAAIVDASPLILASGAIAHFSQLNSLGWTVPASIFANQRTMLTSHRATLVLPPLLMLLQSLGVEYRYYIPRWAHERERGRDEAQVREHVNAGMGLGLIAYVARMAVFGAGRRFWAPIEVVLGGGLADVMHREFTRAHGHSPNEF